MTVEDVKKKHKKTLTFVSKPVAIYVLLNILWIKGKRDCILFESIDIPHIQSEC